MQEGIERARDIIVTLRRDAEDGTAILALYEIGQSDLALNAFGPGQGHVPILIRGVLLQRLLMHVARQFDQGRDTDSLRNVFRLLGDERTAAALLFDPSAQPVLDFAIQRWRKLKNDARFRRIRDFRTYILAHSIPRDFERPLVEDLVSGAEDAFAIVEALGVCTGLGPDLLKHTRAIYRERAAEYWGRLAHRAA